MLLEPDASGRRAGASRGASKHGAYSAPMLQPVSPQLAPRHARLLPSLANEVGRTALRADAGRVVAAAGTVRLWSDTSGLAAHRDALECVATSAPEGMWRSPTVIRSVRRLGDDQVKVAPMS